MILHLSIQVPWNDRGYDGTPCCHPIENTYCRDISKLREALKEEDGMPFDCQRKCELYKLPCAREGGAFMNKDAFDKEENWNGRYIVRYPAYSVCGKNLGNTSIDTAKKNAYIYGYEFNEELEKGFHNNRKWVNHEKNQKSIHDWFFSTIEPEQSLCFLYSPSTPLSETKSIIGIGLVKKKPQVPDLYPNNRSSRFWETPICHTIRPDGSGGVLLPYQELLAKAESDESIVAEDFVVSVPASYRSDFGGGMAHVSPLAAESVLKRTLEVLQKLHKKKIGTHTAQAIEWVSEQLTRIRKMSGIFPALGAMMVTLGEPCGLAAADAIRETARKEHKKHNLILEAVVHNKHEISDLPHDFPKFSAAWDAISNDEKELFWLLSRMSLSVEQAKTAWSIVRGRETSYLRNPYCLYETTKSVKSRENNNETPSPVMPQNIDTAFYPGSEVSTEFPDDKLSLPDNIEQMRARAYALHALEELAREDGHSICSYEQTVNKMKGLAGSSNSTDFPSPDVLHGWLEEDKEHFCCFPSNVKLKYLEDCAVEIRNAIAHRLEIHYANSVCDWRRFLGTSNSEHEKKAEAEKVAILPKMENSALFVLCGGAGTGKTTLLAAFCSGLGEQTVLLAPTGKARVRIQKAMQKKGVQVQAQTLAQFLLPRKAWVDDRYQMPVQPDASLNGKTIIVDECSMLTEPALAALLKIAEKAKRVLLVGDPNQLPPIGEGKPFYDLLQYLKGLEQEPQHMGELKCRMRGREIKEHASALPTAEALAQYFSENGADFPEQADGKSLIYHKWDTTAELEDLIVQHVREVANLGENEVLDFRQCEIQQIDDWQILSPVHDGTHGDKNINRLIQEKVRNQADYRFHQGDKVINLKNKDKASLFPYHGNGAHYIANGDVGILKTEKYPYLNVELISHPSYTYGYIQSDEKLTINLAHAYALTIHKAQGSEYKKVILVLSKKSRLMSRELLYTALTRQTEQLIILADMEMSELAQWHSESTINKRKTDLFQHTEQ